MSPVDAVQSCLRRYADGSGRAGRAEFWWFYGFVGIAVVVAGVAGNWFGVGSPIAGQAVVIEGQMVTLGQYYQPGWLQLAVALVCAPPMIAVQIRRLHDRGLSGWWWWLNGLNLICCLGSLILVFAVDIHPSVPQANSYGDPAGRLPAGPRWLRQRRE